MMYLNVNVAANASAGGEGSCAIPRTPEILNLLASGPFDNLSSFETVASTSKAIPALTPNNNASTPGDGPSSPREHASLSSMSSPGTPSTPSSSTGLPSIQNTRTYLIKEGLKITIQSKRLASGRCSLDHEQVQQLPKEETGQLTPEDEERRRRRRERNKVAATKCRNRKKERTSILIQESESLEDQNVGLRAEIQRLENEKRRLMDVLTRHSPNCMKSGTQSSPRSAIYMNIGETEGQNPHYTMPSGILPTCHTYNECLPTGAQNSPTNSYSNPNCNIYDCRAPSVPSVMTTSVSHSGFDMSPCLNFSSESSASSYEMGLGHNVPYSANSDILGQSYR